MKYLSVLFLAVILISANAFKTQTRTQTNQNFLQTALNVRGGPPPRKDTRDQCYDKWFNAEMSQPHAVGMAIATGGGFAIAASTTCNWRCRNIPHGIYN